jgi:hypothetical protein
LTAVTLDFNSDPTQCCVHGNYVRGGFRLSPINHYDIVPSGGYLNSTYLGWDFTSNDNPDFLGPPGFGSRLYLDYSGTPFTLQSLFPVGVAPNQFVKIGLLVQSSKGGSAVLEDPLLTAFVGPEWTAIDWLLITRSVDSGTPDMGIDQLTFAVPAAVSEPATLYLLLIALLMWVCG